MRGNPVCIKCKSEESSVWTNAENLGAVCLDCLKDLNGLKNDGDGSGDAEDKKGTMRRTRSMRGNAPSSSSSAASSKGKGQNSKSATPTGTKGKGRRLIFKKTPSKAPTAVATPVTSDSLFYQGLYYQKGDIVSLIDDDDKVYYAQLRGFLTDQYCEKSGVITWLLPTQDSPPPAERFDPATYIIGPEEEMPRKLDCMEFVMHAPSDYYKSQTTPYPTVHPSAEAGFVWTQLPPIRQLLATTEEPQPQEQALLDK